MGLDSPDTGVVVSHDHLVGLELAGVELDVGELEGSVRLLDDERLCLQCLCHDVCAGIQVERTMCSAWWGYADQKQAKEAWY